MHFVKKPGESSRLFGGKLVINRPITLDGDIQLTRAQAEQLRTRLKYDLELIPDDTFQNKITSFIVSKSKDMIVLRLMCGDSRAFQTLRFESLEALLTMPKQEPALQV